MKKILLFLLNISVSLWLTACSTAVTPPPAAPSSIPPSYTPAASPTNTPTLSPTPPPTLSPTSTSTPLPTPRPDLTYLGAVVDEATQTFRGKGGVVSLYVQDLQTGQELIRDPDIAFAGMSLLKIPILIETFRTLDGRPNIYHTQLMTETMALSGNYTANLLLGLISGDDDPYNGTDVVTGRLRQLGLYSTFMAAPYDSIPREGRPTTFLTPANSRLDINTNPDLNMQMTVREVGLLLSWLYNCAQEEQTPLHNLGGSLTAEDCQQALQIMTLNEIGSLIEEGVPDGVPIAHKHGWIGDTHGDAGVIFSPAGDYVLVVILYRPQWLEWEESSPIIANISRLAYVHFNAAAPYPAEMVVNIPTTVPASPTPDLPRAIVYGTSGIGLRLRQTPAGAEMAILPEGSVVLLLDEPAVEQDGTTWRKIRSVLGEEGWVGADYLITQ